MPLLAYCLMPFHFNDLLWLCKDGDWSQFILWLTVIRTQQWGSGPWQTEVTARLRLELMFRPGGRPRLIRENGS